MVTLEKILLDFDLEQKNILPVLKRVDATFGFIGEENARKIAGYFQVPVSMIFETATFYDLLGTEKKKPIEIKICSGANCATKDARRVMVEIEKQLGIKAGDRFNPNVRLEAISCLGQCGHGPVAVINGTVFLRVTPSEVSSILKNYL
jgi:NADH:ubiquinone oxidoreductase subunit E